MKYKALSNLLDAKVSEYNGKPVDIWKTLTELSELTKTHWPIIKEALELAERHDNACDQCKDRIRILLDHCNG